MPNALCRVLLAAAAPACAIAASPAAGGMHYLIETVAGGGGLGDGGPAIAAQLGTPQGIAVDRHGNLYIADTDNHRVRKVTPAGVITTVVGDGQAGARGDGGPAEQARLNLPYSVAADPAGNLYIADLGNHRVRRVNANGVIETVAGTGRPGARGDGGPAVEAELQSPRNLALDLAGNLYIAEFEGHRVRKMARNGTISTAAGNGIAGLAGDGGPAVEARLAFPAGLAVDPFGALYIADSQNHRIRRVRPDGVIETCLGATGGVILQTPVGLALDTAGRSYVAERVPVVRRFNAAGGPARVAGTGMPGYDGDGRGATVSMLLAPADVALDGAGNLYIADGRRIRRVGADGRIFTVAGDAFTRNIGDNGPAVEAILRLPRGVAIDVAGDLYIADSGTHRVRMVAPEGGISTLAGTGTAGSNGDGGPAAKAQLSSPAGVAAELDGSVLVADSGNRRIRRLRPGGSIATASGGPGMPLHGPGAVLAGGSGSFYLADALSGRVLLVNPAGTMTTVAGGDPGPEAQLRSPSALALDAAGSLYIADALNHRVQRVAPGGAVSTVAGAGSPGYSGDGGPAVQAHLNEPRGLAVDGDGNLYIADTGNHAIRKVTAAGTINTIAGTGAPGLGGDGGAAAAAQLNTPWGVALDGSGRLYVADSLNHRIRRLTPTAPPEPIEPIEQAVVVNAATLAPGPVAPGGLVAILGASAGMEANDAIRVLFDGIPAPVLMVEPGRIVAQAPYELDGRGPVHVEVRCGDEARARGEVALAESAPGIFTEGGGSGQALAFNEDGRLNSQADPAAKGSVVSLFATGEGRLEPSAATGAPAQAPYGKPLLPVSLSIGRQEVEILYAGAAPGLAGVMQINARAPAGFVPSGQLEVELRVGAARSQPGVTIAVK